MSDDQNISFIIWFMVGSVIGVGLRFVLSWLIIPLISRYQQAGRPGYGFELKGVNRIRTAIKLWLDYDAPFI